MPNPDAHPRRIVPILLVLAALLPAAPAGASQFVHVGIEDLTRGNETVVRATVSGIHSYWNADQSFILTDVRVRPSQVLKGDAPGDVTFTVMGGTVGDVTTLVLGGADLAPGSEYVLFLSHADLPGAPGRLTTRDHSQAVFEVARGRAFSQAIGQPLVPDALGEDAVPGGDAGLGLDDLLARIHDASNR